MLFTKYIYWVNSGMKRFYKLPLWLRLFIPATLVAVCIAINAVAFTEIWRSIQAQREPTPPQSLIIEDGSIESQSIEPQGIESQSIESQSAESQSIEHQSAESISVENDETLDEDAESKPAPTIDPGATIDEAKAKLGNQATPVIAPAIEASSTEQKYDHFAYPVQDLDTLSLVASYAEGDTQRDELLHPDAAAALHKMIAAARADGIWLVPASGFRSLEDQRSIFSNQTLKQGSPEAAAAISAPPGYSEHHTGYAVDLADGALSQTYDVSEAFAQSPAYAWLIANAATFGFELSFPENNPQGISFEPWHWRYIGTEEAKRLFQKTTQTGQPVSQQPL